MLFTPIRGLSLELGESPVWDDRRQLVFLCDIPTGRLLAIRLGEGAVREWQLGENACSAALCESGRLLVSLRHEIILFDPDTGETKPFAKFDGEPATSRLNDGKVGPDGAFWVGSMDECADRQPICSLYRVDWTGRVERKKVGMKISNGLAWSPDGRRMFHSDSGGQWIDRHNFDVASGAIGDAVRIATLDEEEGRPDGAAMDSDGFYWSAGVSAGCLNRFDETGGLAEKIALPLPGPTMPCFCGAELKTLLITSHRWLSPETLAAYPMSGSILVAASTVAGAPVARMKGL